MAVSITPSRLNPSTHFKVTFVVLLLVMVSPSTAGPDFASAEKLINSLKPDLKYNEICVDGKLPAGKIKSACRLKAVPSVGFLVCNHAPGCNQHIESEVQNIGKLITGGVSTVKIDKNEVIKGVKCGQSSELTCEGFLEGWIDKADGWFQPVDPFFYYETVSGLIKRVRREIKTPEGRKKTAADLQTILTFMIAPQGQYHLICDLQGFFLYSGGFLVSDPQDVKENMGLDKRCQIESEREPTTQQVLNGLNELIDNLSRG